MTLKNIIRPIIVTAVLLLIPFLAMQFNWKVMDPGSGYETPNWSPFDFTIMGILILGIGLVYEFLATKVQTPANRALVGIVLLGIFFLIWAELAVGIFGTPFAGS